MNSEIATAAAWTPADRLKQQTNIALNQFDAAMHQAQSDNQLRGEVLITRQLLKARARKRRTEIAVAVARVAARLARIEGEA